MQQQIQRIKKYNTIFPFVGLRQYPDCHIFAAYPLPPFLLPTFTQVVTAANGKHQAVLFGDHGISLFWFTYQDYYYSLFVKTCYLEQLVLVVLAGILFASFYRIYIARLNTITFVDDQSNFF